MSTHHLDFSPVSVALSPVSKKQGNLTGTVRQIQDSSADLYNLIQKWNNCYLKGAKLLQDIVDLKFPVISRLEEGNEYPNGLQNLCDEFEYIYNDLVSIVSEMQSVSDHFKGIRKLEDMRGNSLPPFLTWPAWKFETESKIIVDAYAMELKIKAFVKENVGHSKTTDILLSFVPIWVHQCYVDEDINFRLEAMLKECGHR